MSFSFVLRRDLLMRLLPSLSAGLIGLVLTATAGYLVSRAEQRNAKLAFDVAAETGASLLRAGLNEYVTKLGALQALFTSRDDEVNRSEFETFANDILRMNSSVQTLSWLPRVRPDDRFAFERAAAAEGLAGYRIKSRGLDGGFFPAGQQDEYFPVLFSTVSKKSPLYGLDMTTYTNTSVQLKNARDNAALGFYPLPNLASAPGAQHGFVFVLPVYRKGMPRDTLDERRLSHFGFVSGAMVTTKMVDTILLSELAPEGIELFFFEPGATPAAGALYGRVSHRWTDPLAPRTLGSLLSGVHWMQDVAASGKPWLTLVAVPTPGGILEPRYDRTWIVVIVGLLLTGGVVVYLWSVARHTLNLSKANKKISELARTDALTALANRRVFAERLTESFVAARRGGPSFAVLYFDLDHFKDINDSLGHPLGDALLRAVADRVRNVLRQSDVIARFGGDEFAVLQAGAADHDAISKLAARICHVVADPFLIEGNEIHITASIGIAPYSAASANPDAMMIQADLALYRSKSDGRNGFCFHSPALDREVEERVVLTEELRGALERGEIELYYQPQVALSSGQILGMEALMRWRHPVRGLVPPSAFIPIAERTGLIMSLGRWALDEVCRQFKDWQMEGIAPRLIAVNVSAVQFRASLDLELSIAGSLARHGVNPGAIELELTESVLMEVAQQNSDCFQRLRSLGLRIAIDDFGTGYSSLHYLTTFPINRLKIAQQLVSKVDADSRNVTVVRAAVQLARDLNIECIAEGVETESQAKLLVSAGCEFAQGYYFSRPVDAGSASELLRRGRIKPTRGQLRMVETSAA